MGKWDKANVPLKESDIVITILHIICNLTLNSFNSYEGIMIGLSFQGITNPNEVIDKKYMNILFEMVERNLIKRYELWNWYSGQYIFKYELTEIGRFILNESVKTNIE